VIFYFSNTP